MMARVSALVLMFLTVVSPSLHAQSSTNDAGAPNMSAVTDVTPDWKYLLRNDDLAALQLTVNADGTTTTSLVIMDTSKSTVSATPQSVTISTGVQGGFGNQGVIASEAAGRVFNTDTDSIAVLTAVNNGWFAALANSDGLQSSSVLKTSFLPLEVVNTRVVMADFNGDGLADPLVFYSNTAPTDTRWGMKVLTAAVPEGPYFTQGPELSADSKTGTAPLANSIVVGDFNGDGRNEIAALLDDYHTIAFYTVDPKTLQITQTTTTATLVADIPTIGKFAVVMTPGQVALAAGLFRQCGGAGNSCQANGVTNADLVVFGQISTIDNQAATFGYSVIPIAVKPGSSGNAFTATVVPQPKPTEDQPFFRFPDYKGASGALAQGAPIALWPRQTDQQLVLGIRTENGASYVEIGSFLPDDGTLATFDWESQTEREYALHNDRLENLWVGNFDNQNPDGSHNGGWQIETYELQGNTPHINIFNIKVPSPFPPATPGGGPTDWLAGQQVSDNSDGIPTFAPDSPSQGFLAPADMQGRSLRLGAPTIVRIPTQVQPDLVLAIPPMHIDYIAPNDSTLAARNKGSGGCTDATTPCVVNLSVIPRKPPAAGQGFASSFNFTSSSNSSSTRKLATSWGISSKLVVGASATFGDGLDEVTQSIKNTTSIGHQGTVANTYGTYSGTTQSLSATTGLSDYLYLTQKAMNVYYYPVLGCDKAANACRTDGQTTPTYVQFSVPDRVRYSDIDGLKQDWYQPVHEPGNVFSYPWTASQLQTQYVETLQPLTGTATCMAIGSSSEIYSTAWTSGQNHDSSVGTTSTFSNETSVSTSTSGGIEDVDSENVGYKLNLAASTSVNTLSVSSTSLSSSKSVSVNVPSFDYVAKCCDYAFGGYVYGLSNTKNPASEQACKAGQTPENDGCVAVDDPDSGKPIDIAGTGPLFVGFLADPVSKTNTGNTDLNCSGSDSWWTAVYTKPDVALNHPGRWNWSGSQQLATFVDAKSTPIIDDNYFYLMKGFFITEKVDSGTPITGPNLVEADPSDSLTLSARVYNYSLVNTTAPVHVRFYGQLYCTSSSSSETSCNSGGAACTTPGLCGGGFLIGSEQTIPSIAGFKASSSPNWTTASVDFAPASYSAVKNGNAYMVFWVVVWMQDANGNLVTEMPGHGLTSVPAAGLKQISDVPFEAYSNNVGMYGAHQHFYICPTSGCIQQSTGLSSTQSGVSIKSLTVSVNPQLLLEKQAKVNATIQAGGEPINGVNVAYYDGDPAKGGTLLDVQQIQHMDADATYSHRSFFTPGTCGTHALYASAWLPNSPEVQATATTSVTIDSVSFVQALINSTTNADISDSQVRTNLVALLNSALQEFQQGQSDAANTSLAAYIQQLALSSGNGTSADSVNVLSAQANVILSCGQLGFALAAQPSSATVQAGTTAQYSLAVTPIGGFTASVALTCFGAPQNGSCSVSTSSVSLDGTTQQRLTLSVTTGGDSIAAAGFGSFHGARSWRIEGLLLLLMSLITAGWIGRRRQSCALWLCLLSTVLGCAVVGCGTSSGPKAAPGTYGVIIRAASGGQVQNIGVTLVVEK
jgi:hypothetical protein